MWYVGLDWADTHHDVDVLDEAGKRVGARRFAHSHDGLNELKQFLLTIAAHPENLACIVETNHGLLITFLLEAGIPVYPVNPKSANQLRKAAGAKTDQIDAHLLAKIGRLDLAELRRLEPDSPIVQELKTLTRDQDALIQTQTRLVNQLTACLKEYYPAALSLFAKLQQRSALVFLQTYSTPQAAQAASMEELTATLRKGKHTSPTRVAPKIVEELHRPQLVASSVTVRTKSRLMLSLVKQLLVVIEDIATYDEEISTLFLTHNDQEIWSSLPRAGKRLAPRLLAEWGEDRARYADGSSVQSLAGTAPVPFQSGNYAKAHKRFACLKPLRNALHQFAWQSTLKEEWARDYYQHKRAEGKTHSMAIRAPATRRLSPGHPSRWSPRDGSEHCEHPRQCGQRLPQRSRPNGSRLVLSADREPFPLLFLPVQRLPPPATAFPTPGVGCFPQTTPSQGRAGGVVERWGHARLGLDWCGRPAPPHGRQLHPLSSCFFLSGF